MEKSVKDAVPIKILHILITLIPENVTFMHFQHNNRYIINSVYITIDTIRYT